MRPEVKTSSLPNWKGASSSDLLIKAMDAVQKDWSVGNVDVTIVAEVPKIAPHREAIQSRVSALLSDARVSIKAKTMEGLGPIGAQEAIACYAVAELLAK